MTFDKVKEIIIDSLSVDEDKVVLEASRMYPEKVTYKNDVDSFIDRLNSNAYYDNKVNIQKTIIMSIEKNCRKVVAERNITV